MKKLVCHLCVVSLLIIAILALPIAAPAQEKPEKVRVVVATSSMAFLVPFIAKDRGFYLKNGAEVEIIQMRPNIAVAALLSGEIDYIELIGSAIRSAARGLPVRAISTSIKSPFFSIIAQNKFKSLKDLKGATIGITSIGGTNHISTRLTLKQFGIDPEKDVKLIAIGDEKLMYDAFKIGRTEAVEDQRDVAAAEDGLQVARQRGGVRDARDEQRDVGRPDTSR